MKLKLATNIGKPDAKKLGLDFNKAKRGKVISVEQEVADVLLKNGWAIQTAAAESAPAEIVSSKKDESPKGK